MEDPKDIKEYQEETQARETYELEQHRNESDDNFYNELDFD